MSNLVKHMHVYTWGPLWYIIDTSSHAFAHIGVGPTLKDAYELRQPSPVLALDQPSTVVDTIKWAMSMGFLQDPKELEHHPKAFLQDPNQPLLH